MRATGNHDLLQHCMLCPSFLCTDTAWQVSFSTFSAPFCHNDQNLKHDIISTVLAGNLLSISFIKDPTLFMSSCNQMLVLGCWGQAALLKTCYHEESSRSPLLQGQGGLSFLSGTVWYLQPLVGLWRGSDLVFERKTTCIKTSLILTEGHKLELSDFGFVKSLECWRQPCSIPTPWKTSQESFAESYLL